MSLEPLDSPVDGGLPSVSFEQEPQFIPLGLAGEVELSEQPIVVDGTAEEIAVASHSTDPRAVPASSTPFVSSKAPTFMETHVSQGSADLTANGVTQKENETKAAVGGYCGATVQQIQGESAQVVAIIPAQVRL